MKFPSNIYITSIKTTLYMPSSSKQYFVNYDFYNEGSTTPSTIDTTYGRVRNPVLTIWSSKDGIYSTTKNHNTLLKISDYSYNTYFPIIIDSETSYFPEKGKSSIFRFLNVRYYQSGSWYEYKPIYFKKVKLYHE